MKDLNIQQWYEQECNKMKMFIEFWKKEQQVYGNVEYPNILTFNEWNQEFLIHKGLLKYKEN